MQEMGVKDVSRVFNLGNWKGEIASLSTYCVLDTILGVCRTIVLGISEITKSSWECKVLHGKYCQ